MSGFMNFEEKEISWKIGIKAIYDTCCSIFVECQFSPSWIFGTKTVIVPVYTKSSLADTEL